MTELHTRETATHTVTLSADVFTKTCAVQVTSKDSGEDFTIREIPGRIALDVFYHPFYYANRELTRGSLVA